MRSASPRPDPERSRQIRVSAANGTCLAFIIVCVGVPIRLFTTEATEISCARDMHLDAASFPVLSTPPYLQVAKALTCAMKVSAVNSFYRHRCLRSGSIFERHQEKRFTTEATEISCSRDMHLDAEASFPVLSTPPYLQVARKAF